MGKRRRKISSGSPWSPRLVVAGGDIVLPRSKEVVVQKGEELYKSQIERGEEMQREIEKLRKELQDKGKQSLIGQNLIQIYSFCSFGILS